MLRARRSCRFAGAVALVAFGCGGNPDAPPSYSTGTTTTSMAASGATGSTAATGATSGPGTGTAAGTSTTGAGGSSGTTSDAGQDAMTADGGGSGGSSGSTDDGGAVLAARCKPDVVWEALGRVDSVPATDFARFGAISTDELAVAWTVANGDIFVADRASVVEPFGTPAKVNASVALAVDRAAMAPTGTSIVAIREDRKGFLGFERASLTDPWTPSSGLEFTQVRVVFEGGTTVSEPVLGADKKSLYFVLSSPIRSPLFYESRWDGTQASWGLPANLPNVDLQSADSDPPAAPHRCIGGRPNAILFRRSEERRASRLAGHADLAVRDVPRRGKLPRSRAE